MDKAEITQKDWQAHYHVVESLKDDVVDIKANQLEYDKRLRTLENSMLQLPKTIQDSITNAVSPLSEENKQLNLKVAELKTDKYKASYDILKWVLISVGGVVITYLMGILLNSIWG